MRRGHEVVVVSLHPGSQQTVEFLNGVKVYRLPIDNIYWIAAKTRQSLWLRWIWHWKDRWNRKAAGRVAKILDSEKPEVVNTHNISGFSASVWPEIKRRNIRLVHTTHDYYVVCVRRTLFRRNKVCVEPCFDCSLLARRRVRESASADALICVSQKTMELHRRAGAFTRVPGHVVFNVSPEFQQRPSASATRSGDEVVFGFIGVFDPKKGLEILLEAVSKLRHQDWRLDIAGTGEATYERRLRGITSDPRVRWLGFTPAPQFFAGIDVAVIPSLWPEPLPYVCFEALQAGKELICADSGGIPEMCRPGPRVSIVVPGDVVALAESMDRAIENAACLRSVNRLDAAQLELFREETVVNRYLEIYS